MSARRVSWVRGAGVCCLAALAIVASGGIYRWLPGGGRLRVRGTVIVGGGGEPLSNLFERLPRNPSNDLRRFKRSERNAPPPKSCGAGAISGLFKGLMRLIEVSATHKLATRPPATPMVPTMRERRRMAVAISAARVLDTSCWITTRSEEHTSELQSLRHLVCRLLLEKIKRLTSYSPHTSVMSAHRAGTRLESTA